MSRTYTIYKIQPLDKTLNYHYVGSTQNFAERKRNHKHHCLYEKDDKHNIPLYKFIRENGGWSVGLRETGN
jgi:hypothetical protein